MRHISLMAFLATSATVRCWGGFYPLPGGATVEFNTTDFLFGQDPYAHPGFFWDLPHGQTMTGVFSGPIRSPLYIWNTSGGTDPQFPGPSITAGNWDGLAFTARSAAYPVLYLLTTETWIRPSDLMLYHLYSATIDFGACLDCNAIRIESWANGDNRVVAAAAHSIPEPSARNLILIALLVSSPLLFRWMRRVQ